MVEPTEAGGAGGAELWRANVRRLTWIAVGANGVGGVLVFLLLGFLLPFAPYSDSHLGLNAVAGAAYLTITLAIGTMLARRMAAPVRDWLLAERPPTAEERALVLATPMRFALLSGFFWALGAVLFTLLNVRDDGWSALIVGGGMLMGGETTCALGYLLAERQARPVTARALAGGAPRESVGPGVSQRLGMAWSLGTGVPLLGILVVAMSGLVSPDDDPASVAGAIAFLAVVGIAVGMLAITVASRSLAEPLAALRGAVGQIEEGDLDVAVPVDDGSEVGLLEAGFNSMAGGLRERERLRDLFGRHVGREVAEAALQRDGEVKLGGEVREVAVVFVDLVGSTRLAHRRPPAEVVALLNSFFSLVVRAVEEQGGWINKFEGDAALCVFGAPTAGEDPAGDALRAARRLSELLASGLEGAEAAIGVSAGPAVAGNVGTEERFEYTVIGDPVNEGARLCELAKQRGEPLLASEAVLRRAAPHEAARWELRESVVLRGRDVPTGVAVPGRRLSAVS
jgi:adenylate cyclase